MDQRKTKQQVKSQLAQKAINTKSKSSRRRARRNKVSEEVYNSNAAVYPQPQATSYKTGNSYERLRSKMSSISKNKALTPDGVAFLKCAFAPPDFQASRIGGIPDQFEGQSLVKKHRLVLSRVFAANLDHYILLAPVPGYSHFTTSVAPGTPILNTTLWQGIPYSDLQSLFGANTIGQEAADIVTKFRFASNHIEIVPTVNAMSWTGTIQAFKIALDVTWPQGGGVGDHVGLQGLNGVNATNANQYTGPFNLGVYSGCYTRASTFQFNSIMENSINLPRILDVAQGEFGQLLGAPYMTGMDNQFESLVVKITGIGTNPNDSCVIKTWACVEYLINPGSGLYEYSTLSPCDELALQLYRKIVVELPVGVSYLDNDTFWQRVLNIIRMVSGSLTVLPGPYGMAAGGINSLATAIGQLTM